MYICLATVLVSFRLGVATRFPPTRYFCTIGRTSAPVWFLANRARFGLRHGLPFFVIHLASPFPSIGLQPPSIQATYSDRLKRTAGRNPRPIFTGGGLMPDRLHAQSVLSPTEQSSAVWRVVINSGLMPSGGWLVMGPLPSCPTGVNRMAFVPNHCDRVTIVQTQPTGQCSRADMRTCPQNVLNSRKRLAQLLGDHTRRPQPWQSRYFFQFRPSFPDRLFRSSKVGVWLQSVAIDCGYFRRDRLACRCRSICSWTSRSRKAIFANSCC